MPATTNSSNAYTVPSVSITTTRTGASSKANELGMRQHVAVEVLAGIALGVLGAHLSL